MKNCEYWQQQISRLLDGDLSPEEEGALWEHIAQCPDCAQAFEEFSQQASVLRAQVVRPPVDLSKLVMARIKTGQTDPASFQRREAKKPVSHRLRSWRKVALAACFVAVVAAGAVTGVYGRGARLSGGAVSGRESAGFLPEARSDKVSAQLPENGAAAAGQAVQAPTDAPAELAGAGETQAPAHTPVPAPESAAPVQDARSLPEPAPETADVTMPVVADEAAPEAPDAPESASALSGSGDSGIMTIMEPPPTQTDVPSVQVFDAAGQELGRIADTAALSVLLTGEPWQGEAAETACTLTLDGTAYTFAQDENGALLWQRTGDAGFTLSPAALSDLEALIVEE